MHKECTEERCEEVLRTALFSSHIELDQRKVSLLARHLYLVIRKNEMVNLTRIDTIEDGAYLHVVDSLLLQNAFDAAPAGPFLDIGTGAGFPGIPLAVVTGRKALLVDSVGKKVAAVNEFLEALHMGKRVQATQERVEVLGKTRRAQFAVVTARAVAQANVLVEYGAPLLMRNGRLVIAKARPSDEEIACADRAAKICGLRRVSRETFELPGDRGHREVISYERIANPSIKLPRPTGVAKKAPLGL